MWEAGCGVQGVGCRLWGEKAGCGRQVVGGKVGGEGWGYAGRMSYTSLRPSNPLLPHERVGRPIKMVYRCSRMNVKKKLACWLGWALVIGQSCGAERHEPEDYLPCTTKTPFL